MANVAISTQTKPAQKITEADLLEMGGRDEWFEIINGEIVPMSPVGVLHVIIAGNIYDILKAYVKAKKLGIVFMDGLIYILHADKAAGIRETRVPDVSFVRKENFPQDFDLNRPFPGAPDLAVEVISPSENVGILMRKINAYLAHGTEQVWVLHPDSAEIHVYSQADQTKIHVYRENDTLTAPSLFPDLEIPVAACFVQDDLQAESSEDDQ